MGLYRRFVLPHLINLTMGSAEATRHRERMVPRARGRVLEIGVGSGLNLPIYGAGVSAVCGLDPSPEMLAMARKRAAAVPVELVAESAEAMPFDDAGFDTVLTTWTLCSIPDPLAALREMRRVLKPDGRLVFIEHGRSPDPRVAAWQRWLNPCWRRFSGGCNLDREIDALIAGAGFAMTELETGYLKGLKLSAFHYWGEARPG